MLIHRSITSDLLLLIDGGVRIADVSRIEMFRISSAGETPVGVFSKVSIIHSEQLLVRPCVTDSLIEEDRC